MGSDSNRESARIAGADHLGDGDREARVTPRPDRQHLPANLDRGASLDPSEVGRIADQGVGDSAAILGVGPIAVPGVRHDCPRSRWMPFTEDPVDVRLNRRGDLWRSVEGGEAAEVQRQLALDCLVRARVALENRHERRVVRGECGSAIVGEERHAILGQQAMAHEVQHAVDPLVG